MDVSRLVKRAKRGNKDALVQLVMVEKDAYYRLALTYTGNQHDALEAMDEMIVKVYENINQLKINEAFFSWSKTILVNACKAIVRKRKRLVLADDVVTVSGVEENQLSTKDDYERSEQLMVIEKLLEYINDQQKEAIQLKYFHDLDYQTIAEMTNVSVGTVKSRVFNGLRKLREHYGGEEIE
ncbi:sigma-70 family RNA polymerase sigma factor [Lederbergia galactosidilytica]|uniref:ECF subfamily RNA polymerase sigma-24 factor n=1 Tax=Lederbergia galactosidilytica TaxID=217031 RepID=A0A0Q9XX16_9BACI|nr:sigma-70 family RNA polymerase sigma factor [Lederbergia galactosidilytica]KRG12269.1 ECF subfamily RNA polymerase sigma-24 factor [Virgibacillus soli]KRG13069.1 ECF subfamily RNA polymerase sigma-24 factor [Lederbergia galactosidilytica]OAK73967.1 ECF subfamily RNA polymerase sigma-24 factor [Lederbergia galactosidilytica]